MNRCPPWNAQVTSDREPRLVRAADLAYHDVQNRASRSLISFDDPRSWHFRMFWWHVPLDYYAGNYRQNDPSRPCLGVNVHVDGVAGSDYRQVLSDLRTLIADIRNELSAFEVRWSRLSPQQRTLHFALILGSLVGRFIQIHPFLDGNGRVSRLIWAWGLLRFGVPIQARICPRPSTTQYGDIMAECMRGEYRPLVLTIIEHLGTYPLRQQTS